MDPIKDGGNWYQYCYSSPVVYYDPDGEIATTIIVGTITKFVVGAAASAVASVVGQAVNYDTTSHKIEVDFSNVDVTDVIVDAVSGGVSSVLPFAKGAKIAADAAVGVIGQVVKNAFNGNELHENTISAGLAAAAGSAISSWLVPDLAFKTSSLPGPELANPTRSFGDAVMNFFSSYPIEKDIARYTIRNTIPYFAGETLAGSLIGAVAEDFVTAFEIKNATTGNQYYGNYFCLVQGS